MGTLRDILATRHGIDITEQQEQILFDDLHAIMEINKTMEFLNQIACSFHGSASGK